MEQESLSLIERLVQTPGLSGHEARVGAIVRESLKGCGRIETDAIGNVTCTLPGSDPGGPVLLFAAHQDEIGFIVSDILENGFLRIFNIGGWNTVTLPSSTVQVENTKGQFMAGVIGQLSPHFMKKGTPPQVPDMDDLFVDIGAADAAQVRSMFQVEIGCLVVPSAPFSFVHSTRRMIGKAFDDRLGVAALVELGHQLASQRHAATVVLAATVQEEVGERGATVLANRIEADMAIVVEGAPADDMPGGPVHPQTCVGKGAHLRIFDPTHIGHPLLLEHVKRIAANGGIPIQQAVRKGGGTDALVLALAQRGIPSIVSGVPVRYAHSHNCVSSLDDYKALIDLLVAVCRQTITKLACTDPILN